MGVPGLMAGYHAYLVPEKARRGCQSPLCLELQPVVSYLVGDGGWTQVPWNSRSQGPFSMQPSLQPQRTIFMSILFFYLNGGRVGEGDDIPGINLGLWGHEQAAGALTHWTYSLPWVFLHSGCAQIVCLSTDLMVLAASQHWVLSPTGSL